MLVYMYFVGYRFLPDIPMKGFDDALFKAKNKQDVPKWKKNASILIMLVMFLGMIFESRPGFLLTWWPS